jgi:GTPase SAR1 family protein
MEDTSEYVSYKKLLIFGSEGVGKSSLIKYIESKSFDKTIQKSPDCKYIL